MPYNKFTDEQIIKALECCANEDASCSECPVDRDYDCRLRLSLCALETINHLNEENDTLRAMIEAAEDHYNPLPFKGIFDEKIAEAKAEAIKEFAKSLRTKRGSHGEIWGEDIDNLVKEMTEETK